MGKTRRIFSFILALALTAVGAVEAIYVLFFAAGGLLQDRRGLRANPWPSLGLIWLSDFIDTPSP
jgi:hypothetical protein